VKEESEEFPREEKKSFGAIHFVAIVELVEYLQPISEKKKLKNL